MANLTPEQLAAIQAYYAPASSGWSPAMQSPYQVDGQAFQASYGGQGQGKDAQPGTLENIYTYDPNKQEAFKDKFNVYGADGKFSNEGTFKTDDAMQTFLMMLAAAGGMAFLPGGALSSTMGQGSMAAQAGLEAGGAAGGASGASGLASAAGDAFLPGQLGANGVNMSTAALPGTSFMNASGLSTVLDKAGLGGAASAASGAGGASSWLGPAATLLGAVAGSQGQKTSSTSERKTDPRVDPYLFGNDDQMGLLGYAYNQLARDQSPERLAQRDQMRSTGMGLLNQPIAGNGFTRFFPGR